jgi:hypothetical protein
MTSEVFSNSQLRTWKRCRRKYWLAYVRKLKLRRYAKTGARQLGTRVHGALEAFYSLEGVSGREAAIAWLEALRVQELESITNDEGMADPDVQSAIEKEHGLAVVMIEGYCQWLEEEGADSDLEIIASEVALRTPSPVAGVELIGKLDAVVRKISTGEEGFIDHKTVGSLTDPLKALGMDEQFRMYALMQRVIAAADGKAPIRFQLYNMLKKSKRTTAAKPPFFARYEVYINDAELRTFWERLYGEITDILAFERAIEADALAHNRLAYPNPTGDCSWDCDYYRVCALFNDSASDPEYILENDYEVGDPHAHYDGKLTQVADPVAVQSTAQGVEGEE